MRISFVWCVCMNMHICAYIYTHTCVCVYQCVCSYTYVYTLPYDPEIPFLGIYTKELKMEY